MTTEISKCAWCGKEPTMTGDLYVYCNNRHCVQFDYADNGIEFWNQHQENFLAQRRKDFEAGFEELSKEPQCSGRDDCNRAFDNYLDCLKEEVKK